MRIACLVFKDILVLFGSVGVFAGCFYLMEMNSIFWNIVGGVVLMITMFCTALYALSIHKYTPPKERNEKRK